MVESYLRINLENVEYDHEQDLYTGNIVGYPRKQIKCYWSPDNGYYEKVLGGFLRCSPPDNYWYVEIEITDGDLRRTATPVSFAHAFVA